MIQKGQVLTPDSLRGGHSCGGRQGCHRLQWGPGFGYEMWNSPREGGKGEDGDTYGEFLWIKPGPVAGSWVVDPVPSGCGASSIPRRSLPQCRWSPWRGGWDPSETPVPLAGALSGTASRNVVPPPTLPPCLGKSPWQMGAAEVLQNV